MSAAQLSFEDFFLAVNGQAPFPWQVRSAERLMKRTTFSVTVPTGLGKSALVDAAIWAAGQGAWRRIAFVVDRRIVVDAVFERATRIAQCLRNTRDPRLQAFAERLGELQIVRLRGGVFGDDDWVLHPDRVSIVLSTVDQVGSRLLHRGYGVSPRRWPMHAGFFSSDTLIVVDEAHLSIPFLQTLQALRRFGAGIDVVPMSATLPEGLTADSLALGADDLTLPVVQQRLHARKQAVLIETSQEAEFVQVATDKVRELAQQDRVKRLALVVNRVAMARKCFDRLRKEGVNCVLLTGRVRQVDRDRQLQRLLKQIQAGRSRASDEGTMVVVATQTIEVGADFDFDALVTECAPLSALRQRFGRLDRLGELSVTSACILWRVTKDRDDPVYGPLLAEAWDWLKARAEVTGGVVDFGLAAFDESLRSHPAPIEKPLHAASLLPTHVQMLAQTGAMAPELDISAWLHGATDRAPDVNLVWRDDLLPATPDLWAQATALVPPMQHEVLAMPAPAVRRWLAGERPGEQWPDLETTADDDKPASATGRPVLRWRGADDVCVVMARDIRPGDTLMLPAQYGGCDEWGWAPESTTPVPDRADDCMGAPSGSKGGQRIALRLADNHWPVFEADADALREQVRALNAQMAAAAESGDDLDADVLEQARADLITRVLTGAHPLAARLQSPTLETHPSGYVIRGVGVEEIDGAVEIGRAVPLDVHHRDVGRWAGHLANGHPHCHAITLAGEVHDAGKAEPRMQALLHGSRLKAMNKPPLAKSAFRRRDEQLAALLTSGLPRRFRHEFASLVYADLADPLVRHLVATHHGHGRPWLTPCDDPNAAGASFAHLEQHWLQSWADVSRRFDPWSLAGMEWLLRAADARASIEETTRPESEDETR